MESLEELREVMTCVVCLHTLSPLAIQCSRGHALCQGCRQDQVRCPLCGNAFLIEKPTLLCQIAAIVGGNCKFAGCTYIRERENDNHQLWCGFMPTNCKLCNWSGYGKDILSHVQEAHQDALVLNKSGNIMQKLEHCISTKQSYVPFSNFGLLLWLQIRVLNMDWENRLSVLALQVCLIPDGKKIDNDLYFTIEFRSDDCDYNIKKKVQLKMLPKEFPNEKSCVFIPSLVFDGGSRSLRMNIVRKQVLPSINHLSPCTNYSVNKLRNYCVTFKNLLGMFVVNANEIVFLTLVFLIVCYFYI